MSPPKDFSSTSPGKESAPAPPIVRRSKTMPTDSPSAKFLYTIIKQLDLKGIDWNLVASQLEISNGHAARMRYHRFRNQMEGIHTTQRKRTSTKPPKSSMNPLKAKKQKEITPELTQEVKNELKGELFTDSTYKTEPHMKTDLCFSQESLSLADIPQYEPQTLPDSYPHSHSSSFPPPIATPYHDMPLTPEFRMYSPMPPYPPVPNSVQQSYQSPVEWTPVKVGPWSPSEVRDDTEIEKATVKKESEAEETMVWKE